MRKREAGLAEPAPANANKETNHSTNLMESVTPKYTKSQGDKTVAPPYRHVKSQEEATAGQPEEAAQVVRLVLENLTR